MKSDAEIIEDFKKYTNQIYSMKHDIMNYYKRFEQILSIFEQLDGAEYEINQIITELWRIKEQNNE